MRAIVIGLCIVALAMAQQPKRRLDRKAVERAAITVKCKRKHPRWVTVVNLAATGLLTGVVVSNQIRAKRANRTIR